MSPEDKEIISDIEYVLCARLRPTFLAIHKEPEINEIHIIISTIAFYNMSIQQRVSSVFNLLNYYLESIIRNNLVVIETYDGNEISELLETIFE